MDETSKINALINIGQNKVIEKAYDDVLSTPSKKLGNALGTVLDLGNTCLWPVKWINERVRIFFENNLKKYEQKLSQIESEKIAIVPSEIAIPILERFTYVSNEEISNAFVNLLTNASNTDTASFAHPGFIRIIDRLSPDEAKILLYLKNVGGAVHMLTFAFYTFPNKYDQWALILKDETGLKAKLNLLFPDNIDIYFDNLCSLGLIEKTEYFHKTLGEDGYKDIEDIFKDHINANQPRDIAPNEREGRIKRTYGMIIFTHLGKLFLKSIQI